MQGDDDLSSCLYACKLLFAPIVCFHKAVQLIIQMGIIALLCPLKSKGAYKKAPAAPLLRLL